jgi:hypothetical protein
METLHNHLEMIDLNPLLEERHPIKPPTNATPEEFHCLWYSVTDRVSYMPGGLVTGKVSYMACLHDLERGLQTHCYAPMGLNIKGKWTLGGSLPGEPVAPVELGIGAPLSGLYIREDVDMKCNIMMTSMVKKTLKAAHARLVDRLVIKAQFEEAEIRNERLSQLSQLQTQSLSIGSQATTEYSPSDYGDAADGIEDGSMRRTSSRFSNQSGVPQLPVISSPGFSSPSSLTVQGAVHNRSLSRERQQQRPYPDFDAVSAASHQTALSRSYVSQQRPQAPYPVSVTGTPQGERASWQGPPLNANNSMEELDVAFEEAAPAYHDYVEVPAPLQLPSNLQQYGGGETRDRMYDGVPRVYGAAELA